jgi:hypothetical protein
MRKGYWSWSIYRKSRLPIWVIYTVLLLTGLFMWGFGVHRWWLLPIYLGLMLCFIDYWLGKVANRKYKKELADEMKRITAKPEK